MAAPLNNKNAQKEDPNDYLTSTVMFRCRRSEKVAYVRASRGGKLSDWIRHHLNLAAKPRELPAAAAAKSTKVASKVASTNAKR